MIKKPSTKTFIKLMYSIPIGLLSLIPGLSSAAVVPKPINTFLPPQIHVVSTVPENGDGNPYGVAFVPKEFPAGTIKPGDLLVSNFNDNEGLQGKGRTIISISPQDTPSLFFQSNGFLGLTTALNVLKKGLVLAGSFPSTDGTCGNASKGSLLVINNNGQPIQELSDPDFINGPWDSALFDEGDTAKLFLANALSGTVVRLDLAVDSNSVTIVKKAKIASGYQHQCDPVTFVNAPTGLVYDSKTDILYVASTMDNKIYRIRHAGKINQNGGKGETVFSDKKYLHGPLAMMLAPNGHLVVSNNDAINPDPNNVSALTEFTIKGKFIKQITLDPSPGAAFGLNQETEGKTTRFAAVNDNQNNLFIWKLVAEE